MLEADPACSVRGEQLAVADVPARRDDRLVAGLPLDVVLRLASLRRSSAETGSQRVAGEFRSVEASGLRGDLHDTRNVKRDHDGRVVHELPWDTGAAYSTGAAVLGFDGLPGGPWQDYEGGGGW